MAMDEKSLELLKKIHEQELIVLSSHHVAYPRYGHDYDSGEAVPDDEWKQIKSLWKSWDEEKSFVDFSETFFDRTYVNSQGINKVEKIVRIDVPHSLSVTKPGHERVELVRYSGGNFDITLPPDANFTHDFADDWECVGEDVITDQKQHIERYKDYHWESDYLMQESIEMDEFYEEKIGLQTRYILTDKAKQMIGVNNDEATQ